MRNLTTWICHLFELTDYEYIRGEFGRWPFRFFVTVIEPNHRWKWHRKRFPWRIRCCAASLLLKWVRSRCTKCGRAFLMRELLRRNGNLIHFQSGSICHRECPHDCLEHLVLKQAEWTETHGLDCGPYEHGWDEWWECAVCGNQFTERELQEAQGAGK